MTGFAARIEHDDAGLIRRSAKRPVELLEWANQAHIVARNLIYPDLQPPVDPVATAAASNDLLAGQPPTDISPGIRRPAHLSAGPTGDRAPARFSRRAPGGCAVQLPALRQRKEMGYLFPALVRPRTSSASSNGVAWLTHQGGSSHDRPLYQCGELLAPTLSTVPAAARTLNGPSRPRLRSPRSTNRPRIRRPSRERSSASSCCPLRSSSASCCALLAGACHRHSGDYPGHPCAAGRARCSAWARPREKCCKAGTGKRDKGRENTAR